MMTAIVLAILAAVLVAAVAALLARPGRAVRQFAARVRWAMSLRTHEDQQRAIERIAAELTQRRCDEEGNPDDEYREDFWRWFTGDPDANVDYSRKQQRDQERLERGDFRPQH